MHNPSDAAVAQAFREAIKTTQPGEWVEAVGVHWLLKRAREIEAQLHANATPPVAAAPVVDEGGGNRPKRQRDLTPNQRMTDEQFDAGLAALATNEGNAYTAGDIAQASADGFRAGVASVAAPDGDWVAVPRVPTHEMLTAGALYSDSYAAMIAAAPKPEGV